MLASPGDTFLNQFASKPQILEWILAFCVGGLFGMRAIDLLHLF